MKKTWSIGKRIFKKNYKKRMGGISEEWQKYGNEGERKNWTEF